MNDKSPGIVVPVLEPCAGCEDLVEGDGYTSGSHMPETFCSKNCYERTMERRAEKAHDLGR